MKSPITRTHHNRPHKSSPRQALTPGTPARLTSTLEFMQVLWALVHALEQTSKRMTRDVGVTGPQRLVLRVVGLAPGLSAGDLAAVLHVHPSTLTGVLGRLVRDELISRTADRSDRRRARLSLTAKGARVNAKRRGTVEAAVSTVLAGIEPRERAATIRVLQRLREGLAAGIEPAPGQ